MSVIWTYEIVGLKYQTEVFKKYDKVNVYLTNLEIKDKTRDLQSIDVSLSVGGTDKSLYNAYRWWLSSRAHDIEQFHSRTMRNDVVKWSEEGMLWPISF